MEPTQNIHLTVRLIIINQAGYSSAYSLSLTDKNYFRMTYNNGKES